MLTDVLKKEYIRLNVECSDWEDSIRTAGKILLDNDVVTEEYIEDAIEGVKELNDVEYEIMPDRIEAGTLLCAAAVCKRKSKNYKCRT